MQAGPGFTVTLPVGSKHIIEPGATVFPAQQGCSQVLQLMVAQPEVHESVGQGCTLTATGAGQGSAATTLHEVTHDGAHTVAASTGHACGQMGGGRQGCLDWKLMPAHGAHVDDISAHGAVQASAQGALHWGAHGGAAIASPEHCCTPIGGGRHGCLYW